MEFAFRKNISGKEIAEKRKTLKLTQDDFAKFCGVSKKTIQRLENSEMVSGSIVTIIEMLSKDEKIIDNLKILDIDKRFPLRLNYYKKDRLCTTIDVDEINQKIRFKNYSDLYSDCAFGNNISPTYHDYEEFLKSRCFPESRDKIKVLLKDLNLPFYDPLMIIEKTKGKMAEDDFWIDIKRY